MNMNNQENETQVQMESEFSKLNISNRDSNSVITNNKNCSYCNKPFIEELWCKKCDPFRVIEGWSSGNPDIDKLIKDTMYNRNHGKSSVLFLEWVPFDRFEDIKQIGEGGFSKVYSATWIDGQSVGRQYINGNWEDWKKIDPKPMKVALKRLNGSQNISAEYLNELKTHWKFCLQNFNGLKFYGMTKDPKTEEFLMIMQFANQGSLRSVLSSNFNNISWKYKIRLLWGSANQLKHLHELEYFHKDFHSGNILQINHVPHISDFGLSGLANEQKSDCKKICGVLPYIAPEVLNEELYTLSSDIYSFGIIMAEVSSGKPPFHKRKHDVSLALSICNGLRPEFGKGTPEIYKKLAYRCMNSNSDQRPTANELLDILGFWYNSLEFYFHQETEKFGYKGKEIKSMFEEADKEIPSISTSYEKDSDAIYTSRTFTFSNLPNPINSLIISSYLNDEDCQDPQAANLGISAHYN